MPPPPPAGFSTSSGYVVVAGLIDSAGGGVGAGAVAASAGDVSPDVVTVLSDTEAGDTDGSGVTGPEPVGAALGSPLGATGVAVVDDSIVVATVDGFEVDGAGLALDTVSSVG